MSELQALQCGRATDPHTEIRLLQTIVTRLGMDSGPHQTTEVGHETSEIARTRQLGTEVADNLQDVGMTERGIGKL